MGLREAAGVCPCRSWFLEEHDVVSFRVCQCKGKGVDRRNLADVGLKDPDGLFSHLRARLLVPVIVGTRDQDDAALPWGPGSWVLGFLLCLGGSGHHYAKRRS
jgi:hypothetical protein